MNLSDQTTDATENESTADARAQFQPGALVRIKPDACLEDYRHRGLTGRFVEITRGLGFARVDTLGQTAPTLVLVHPESLESVEA